MKVISDYKKALEENKLTCRQIVQEVLNKIESTQEDHNTVISTAKERALQRADEIDELRRSGKKLGRLAGVPFIAKDNFLTFGSTTTAASKILEPYQAQYQATAIEKLEAEGAIMVAKANLDAFAHGGSTENSYFGPSKNPHDINRVPGGSSGGSAAAVALNLVPFTLGTDTGGSIRQPSSYCGVVGIKPTYGLISRYGVVAMASSTDVIGAMAHTTEDVALVTDIMAGKDIHDSTTLPEREDSYLPSDNKIEKPLRIGLIKEYMGDNLSNDVRERISKRVQDLKELGHQVEEVSIPSIELALAIYYIVVPAELCSNLARYDGIRYGYQSSKAKDLDEVYGLTRDEGFMPENKRRILIGNYVLSSGYYDAYYRKAQTARTILIDEFNKAFDSYDLLIGPVAPTTAFELGSKADDPLQMYLADIMTVAMNLAGLPAISLPSGSGENSLPVGLQIIGPQKTDAKVFALAQQLEESDHE